MKVKTQKAMFPNKELRVALSKEVKLSRNWFAWNVLSNPNSQTLVPLYLDALKDLVVTPYEKEAKSLLKKFIQVYKEEKQTLNLPSTFIEQYQRVTTAFKKVIQKANKKLEYMDLPLTEYAAMAKDPEYIREIKSVLHVFNKHDIQMHDLKVKLNANKELSHDPARIVDLPGCQKTLLVPHPHTDSHIARYFQSVLEHKAAVLISLCSPYEHQEVIPFWEDREVHDLDGRSIKCSKISEKVLYQSPKVAIIRDENRAMLAREAGLDFETFFPRIVERRLLLQREDMQHEVVHLHYENWPDHQEAPDIDALEVLIEHKDSLVKPDDVVMLNCKATIGRSGVFFFSDLARKRVTAMANDGVLFSEMKLNFADMMRQVRRFRPILSGNLFQMSQVFEVIAKHYEALQTKRVELYSVPEPSVKLDAFG